MANTFYRLLLVQCQIVVVIFFVNVVGQEKFTLSTSDLFNGISSTEKGTTEKAQLQVTKVPVQKLVCPENPRFSIFSLPCYAEKDCKIFGPALVCCKQRCIKGELVSADAAIRKTRISNLIEAPETKTTTASPTTTTTAKAALQVIPNLVCPGSNVRVPLLSLPCKNIADCKVFGADLVCCTGKCLKGMLPPEPEIKHTPALFGLVDRHCPAENLAEIFDIKECKGDDECNPRICCPERNAHGYIGKSYCRTPIHNIQKLPGGKQIEEPLRNLVSYMQCTAPPPAVIDLFPKPCSSGLDCFPNLCCQENGKRFCRPPKKSLVSLVAGVTTRLGAAEVARRFIERITK